MITGADVRVEGATARLSQGGKRLEARILSPPGTVFSVLSTRPPTAAEKQNRGTRMLAVRAAPPKSGDVRIAVLLTPGSAPDAAPPPVRPLSTWKERGP
jgi:hypothetical protein